MILEQAGFKAVFMSGYGVAASFLGNPDIGLTSLVETASLTRNITASHQRAARRRRRQRLRQRGQRACARCTSWSTPAPRR